MQVPQKRDGLQGFAQALRSMQTHDLTVAQLAVMATRPCVPSRA